MTRYDTPSYVVFCDLQLRINANKNLRFILKRFLYLKEQ